MSFGRHGRPGPTTTLPFNYTVLTYISNNQHEFGMKRSRSEQSDEAWDTAEGIAKFVRVEQELKGHSYFCNLPPCKGMKFSTIQEFETHYYRFHCNKCLQCHRIFPSESILNIHITENHDPIAEARKARGENIYACLEPNCDRVCSEDWKRQRHMIDKHQYSGSFDFKIIKFGLSSHQMSLLRR